MDALTYLIGRNWPSGTRCAAILLTALGLSWFNGKLLLALPSLFPGLHQYWLLNSLWGLALFLVWLVAVAALTLGLAVAPFYGFNRALRFVQSWTRQRVLDEMICAGMSGGKILDGLVLYSVRWWATVATPCLLVGGLWLSPHLGKVSPGSMAWAIVLYILACLGIGYTVLAFTCLSSTPGGQVKVPLALGAGALSVGPAGIFAACGGEPGAVGFALGFLYLCVAARALSTRALENQDRLASLEIRFRRMLRFQGGKVGTLAENPIVARESFRGSDASDTAFRAITLGGFIFCSLVASLSNAPWIFLFLLFPVVLRSAYRSASRMSQVVTEEVEGSTIETIRSTPMSSGTFLNGWLRVVVGAQWRDLGMLFAGVFAVLLLNGNGVLLNNGMVAMGVFLSALLPLVGAYVGASIAGQAKTRSQISGQLMASFAAVMVVGVPQVVVSAEIIYPPVTMVALAVLAWAICWVLDAGARKSLNRTFLPQR